MWMLLLLFLLGISHIKADIPGCDYFDTVKLTEQQKLPNGSYRYEKIIIPSDQVGEYDYEILVYGEKVNVTKHLRGCACHFGSCIRYCCPKNQILVPHERKCVEDLENSVHFDGFVEISNANGKRIKKHNVNDLIVQQDLPVPCADHFSLEERHNWRLMESGYMELELDGGNTKSERSKQEYCFQPQWVTSSSNESIVQLIPRYCPDLPQNPWPSTILFLLSIICLILTIIVYLTLPKLRNLHGICFICYLLSLVVAFMLLLCDKWILMSEWTCKINGYAGYFAVMSVFHWLTVMSFDLWKSFRGTNYNVEYTIKHRFTIYAIVVWASAGALTIIIIILDSTLDSNDDDVVAWMPGVALYNCWVKTHDWSAMIYYYGPMSIQIVFNLIMFVLTAISILKVMAEMKSVGGRYERHQRLELRKKDYGLFVRLFVIMGVSWSFEIFSYLAQYHQVFKYIFIFFFDYINCAQGILIFIMFVLKRSVLKQLLNRGHRHQHTKSISMNVSRSTYKQKDSEIDVIKKAKATD